MRFLVAIGLLLSLALLWPWITNVWERGMAWIRPTRLDASVSSNQEYFCPMDPGIVSVWPAICPICNMDLITRTKGSGVILPSGTVARMQISPYRLSLAGVQTAAIDESGQNDDAGNPILLVPRTSIVFRGDEAVLYVERSPGMLDGVQVELKGRFQDSFRIVGTNIGSGDRVVVMGTLLIDAENRLNPNLSTQYFGANELGMIENPPPVGRILDNALEVPKALNPEDAAIVDAQKICPVTRAELGSMGTPDFVMIEERRIAICCSGCEARLVKDPKKYLVWLDEYLAGADSTK